MPTFSLTDSIITASFQIATLFCIKAECSGEFFRPILTPLYQNAIIAAEERVYL